MTRISELKALNRRRLNIKAKILGLKFNGSKPELIEKIYEIETATANKRIDEMFNKIPKPKQEITNENTSNLTHDNIMNNKRMRDDEDDNVVSNKYQKLK